ncbi:MAG TPA: Gmad2 immunoglobulin-like domain-containing protein, partial [Acidimicrobiia bacterium]
AGCGSSKKALPAGTTTSTVAEPTTTAPTTTAATTTTTAPSAPWIAVWPPAGSDDSYGDPVVAARTFATSYLHFVTPVVGAFQQGDSRSGEVPVQPKSTGPVTTILVRQLGTDGSWSVLGAATPNIRLTEPAALAAIGSPVRLRGSSSAFEGTVQVSIRQDDVAKPLTEGFVTGGSLAMGPFDSTFTFPAPTSSYGAIVLDTISPETGHVSEATVIRVRLSQP